MDEARFRALLDAYGASPSRWPEDERAAAQAFLSAHPRAPDWVDDAARTDALLDAVVMPAPSDLLARRILAQRPRASSVQRWAPAMLAASLAVGVLIGFGSVSAARVEAEAAASLAAALDAPAYLETAGVGG